MKKNTIEISPEERQKIQQEVNEIFPKPTSEWTAAYVSELWQSGGNQNVVNAHNAALAEAHRIYKQDMDSERQLWQEQLAAERKSMSDELEAAMEAMLQNRQLREQLAAERKEINDAYTDWNQIHDEVKQLREQLVAEREAYQRDMEEAHRVLSRKNEQLAAAVEALKEVERLAKGNITGCGTCHSIRESIKKYQISPL